MKQSTRVTNDPYMNLGIAVLRRAVEDCVIKRKLLLKGGKGLALLVTDPEYYIFESESWDFPSFLCVCDMVGISPEYLRGIVRGYLLQKGTPGGLSPAERVRLKIKFAPGQEIMRSRLTSWAWDNMKIRSKELSRLVTVLDKKDEIIIERRKRSRGWATFYLWVGD